MGKSPTLLVFKGDVENREIDFFLSAEADGQDHSSVVPTMVPCPGLWLPVAL